jgi:hypothetical protein
LVSAHCDEGDPLIEDTEIDEVVVHLRTCTLSADEQRQHEERERVDREHAAKLNCGELRTHITAGEVEEILKALADRIDTAHSRPVTEGRPEGIKHAYAAYEKLYTVRRKQHYQGVPWSPSEHLIYHWSM